MSGGTFPARAVAIQDLLPLASGLAAPDQPGMTLRALDDLLCGLVGHRLFTALLYRRDQGVAERLYSSRPDTFPASGTKALEDAPTMRLVLTTGRPYLGRTAAEVAQDFPDHRKIFALGCGSVLNMPVRWSGAVLGQINLLHASGHFSEAHLSLVEVMAQMAAPAFLMASRSERRR